MPQVASRHRRRYRRRSHRSGAARCGELDLAAIGERVWSGSRRRVRSTHASHPTRLRGATITLSNFGTLGGRHAALVVVPPQVAILGAGRIAPRAVARRRQASRAAHAAAVADLRSSRGHGRRGGALSRRRHGRRSKACRDGGAGRIQHGRPVPLRRSSSARQRSCISMRLGVGLKAIVVIDNIACGPVDRRRAHGAGCERRGSVAPGARDDAEERRRRICRMAAANRSSSAIRRCRPRRRSR